MTLAEAANDIGISSMGLKKSLEKYGTHSKGDFVYENINE
jgi:hypothetical protein